MAESLFPNKIATTLTAVTLLLTAGCTTLGTFPAREKNHEWVSYFHESYAEVVEVMGNYSPPTQNGLAVGENFVFLKTDNTLFDSTDFNESLTQCWTALEVRKPPEPINEIAETGDVAGRAAADAAGGAIGGAVAGAVIGAAAGAVTSLDCGPLVVACAPIAVVGGVAVGAAGGGVVGAVGGGVSGGTSLEEEIQQKIRARKAEIEQIDRLKSKKRQILTGLNDTAVNRTLSIEFVSSKENPIERNKWSECLLNKKYAFWGLEITTSHPRDNWDEAAREWVEKRIADISVTNLAGSDAPVLSFDIEAYRPQDYSFREGGVYYTPPSLGEYPSTFGRRHFGHIDISRDETQSCLTFVLSAQDNLGNQLKIPVTSRGFSWLCEIGERIYRVPAKRDVPAPVILSELASDRWGPGARLAIDGVVVDESLELFASSSGHYINDIGFISNNGLELLNQAPFDRVVGNQVYLTEGQHTIELKIFSDLRQMILQRILLDFVDEQESEAAKGSIHDEDLKKPRPQSNISLTFPDEPALKMRWESIPNRPKSNEEGWVLIRFNDAGDEVTLKRDFKVIREGRYQVIYNLQSAFGPVASEEDLRLAQCLLYASNVGTWTRSGSGRQYAKFPDNAVGYVPKKVRLPEALELVWSRPTDCEVMLKAGMFLTR